MAIAVFGLDGALVDRRHRLARIAAMRMPGWDAERETVAHDVANEHVVALVQALHAAGHRIVLLSDRPAWLDGRTRAFLDQWNVPWHEVYFRPVGDDARSEEEVEVDLVEDAALTAANVLGVFHDNPAVLAALRKRGLTCYEVGAHGLV